tara:strand:+ start:211 stop:816 length:606 start_codon:yes stop_codon:yes gene_type:complete
MSEYTLSNTALDIDSAITRVVKADNEPKPGSQNMVTSGGVAAAIVDIGSGSNAVITVDSFTETSLHDSNDGLSSTDTAIPTSKAVADYISNQSFITIEEISINLPGGRRVGHPTNKNYHNSVTVNIPGFSQIFHIELTPKSHGDAIPSTITTQDNAVNGFVMTFDNSSATFAGPIGNSSGSSRADTGNGYTTTFKVFGIKS